MKQFRPGSKVRLKPDADYDFCEIECSKRLKDSHDRRCVFGLHDIHKSTFIIHSVEQDTIKKDNDLIRVTDGLYLSCRCDAFDWEIVYNWRKL